MFERPADPVCPTCGHRNSVGARFCDRCGLRLPLMPAPAPPASTPVQGSVASQAETLPASPGATVAPPPAPWAAPMSDAPRSPPRYNDLPDEGPELERTRTGLLLLAIGFALSWIPYVDILAAVLGLVGVVLVILGRSGFDDPHARYVLLGTVLLVVGVLVSFFGGLAFLSSVVNEGASGDTGSTLTHALQGDVTGVFEISVLAAIVTGLGNLVLVYALADRPTRVLLWGSFLSRAVLTALVVAVLLPQVNGAVAQAVASNPPNLAPVEALQGMSQTLSLVLVVPALLSAYAFARTRDRVYEHVPKASPAPDWSAPG